MAGRAHVEVVGLTKRYGATTVVDGISLAAEEGEFLTLLGPSGCGKTTTLRCIGGFLDSDGGDILIGGSRVNGVPPYRRELGMVFQTYALFPHLTVFENVAFGLRVRKVDPASVRAQVERALQMVRLEGYSGRLPRELSGGQQQRVAVARALVYRPKVLLLDEPLSNLDAKLRVEMRSEIRSLQKDLRLTVIYVTHDQEEALSVSDRIAVMNAGRIEQVSTPWEIYNSPRTRFVASFVGTANFLPLGPSPAGAGFVRIAQLVDVPAGPAAGAARWALIRPENVLVGPPQGDGFDATIGSASLLGANIRVQIRMRAGFDLVADIPHGGSRPRLEAGSPVRVALDASKFVVLDS